MSSPASLIRSSKANCKNCYRCIRNCPVKAIRFKGSQADVMETCIACGLCIRECPQKAMHVPSDMERVREMLAAGDVVKVSLAPSHVAYEQKPGSMKQKLEEIGFAEIRETAEAAELVSVYYAARYQETGRLLTTACPVIVELIERHYPQLLPCLAETDSPMIAHAKLIKAVNPSAKVVFIGPCYAKMKEARMNPGWIDAVLTFDEVAVLAGSCRESSGAVEAAAARGNMAIDDGFPDEAAASAANHGQPRGMKPEAQASTQVARLYPMDNGVIETTFFGRELPELHRAFSGLAVCRSVLSELDAEHGSFFLELNACSGGCINGPVSGDGCGLLEKQRRIREHRRKPASRRALPPLPEGALARRFYDRTLQKAGHTEEALRGVLEQFGKHTPSDELNCGACGYSSCREKAEAVLDGKAELYMCMPYMQAKAESLSSVVMDKTPNGILAVSEELIIQEANEAACRFFDTSAQELVDVPVELFVDPAEVPFTLNEKTMNKVYFADRRKTAMVTVTYLPDFRFYLLVLTDLTERELEQEKLQRLREETVEMAQKVIDNQMRVSQEIASLLGETTAVTKVTLTKMKQLISRG
ncbi:[Fe-Fe] hydrogenase large subunit C-terminal domain-containing protein [Gorillibacterium sp. CAU 1737]|uniref:[Fe-Fe] hydrogenase large subunit C-terminal domain-containing protein n=1 Tax=Gorillibacterium sp. CAU 1737 TaxID=3140362 RepID=UPI003260B619